MVVHGEHPVLKMTLLTGLPSSSTNDLKGRKATLTVDRADMQVNEKRIKAEPRHCRDDRDQNRLAQDHQLSAVAAGKIPPRLPAGTIESHILLGVSFKASLIVVQRHDAARLFHYHYVAPICFTADTNAIEFENDSLASTAGRRELLFAGCTGRTLLIPQIAAWVRFWTRIFRKIALT